MSWRSLGAKHDFSLRLLPRRISYTSQSAAQEEIVLCIQVRNSGERTNMKIVERIISIVAPFDCISCGAEGSLFCAWCAPDACLPLPERCYRCHKLSQDSRTCTSCRSKSPLKAVWVATEYEGLAKDLIHKLKFERASAAAQPIAKVMAEVLPYLSERTIITHVPTASSRYRQRGYDQAELIAKELAKLKRVRYMPLVGRVGQTRQVGAKRATRLVQLQGAFRPKAIHSILDAEILLVDDITTTGVTLESAAKVLKAAGAKRIYATVFARKT